VLLQTFTTEEDLKLAHDGKVAAIDSRIKHSEQIVERLEQSRTELQGDAASLERGGKKVPDELHKQITDVQSQIDKTLGEIERRKDERVLLQERFRADLARYRELKGG
jgi:exonuclease VII small subunit